MRGRVKISKCPKCKAAPFMKQANIPAAGQYEMAGYVLACKHIFVSGAKEQDAIRAWNQKCKDMANG